MPRRTVLSARFHPRLGQSEAPITIRMSRKPFHTFQRSIKDDLDRPRMKPRAAVYVVMSVLIITVVCTIPGWDCGDGSRTIDAAQAKRLLLSFPITMNSVISQFLKERRKSWPAKQRLLAGRL